MRNGVSEQELIEHARTKNAERVTLEGIENSIVSESYMNVEDALVALGGPAHAALGLLTVCTLVLKNGYTILGKSACADPRNFDPEIGKRLARNDAISQIWPLMGYELKSRLYEERQLVESALCEPQEGFEVYIGTKVVNAQPMDRATYNRVRGWTLPRNENGADEGYMVEYTDRIEYPSHVIGYQGYISWSPKEVFERAYRRVR